MNVIIQFLRTFTLYLKKLFCLKNIFLFLIIGLMFYSVGNQIVKIINFNLLLGGRPYTATSLQMWIFFFWVYIFIILNYSYLYLKMNNFTYKYNSILNKLIILVIFFAMFILSLLYMQKIMNNQHFSNADVKQTYIWYFIWIFINLLWFNIYSYMIFFLKRANLKITFYVVMMLVLNMSLLFSFMRTVSYDNGITQWIFWLFYKKLILITSASLNVILIGINYFIRTSFYKTKREKRGNL